MRLLLALALLTALPLAAADQDQTVGPARVVTTNQDTGDACGGENGYHMRTASAEVEVLEDEAVGASFAQWCSDQTSPFFTNQGSGLFVQAYHRVDGNYGPQVYASYSDADVNGWHMCGLVLGVAGVPVHLGCLPAGLTVPLVPALP